MGHTGFVIKNVVRKKIRFLSIFLSVIIAFTLYGMLVGLNALFSGDDRFSADNRLWVTSKFGGPLPLSYVEAIKNVDGIAAERLTYGADYRAYYKDEQTVITLTVVSVDSFIESQKAGTRFVFDQDQLETWRNERSGVMITKAVAEENDLHIGDQFSLVIPSAKKTDGTDVWEFSVIGIFRYASTDENLREVWLNYDYFNESTAINKDQVSYIINVVPDSTQVSRISQEIDGMFRNSVVQTMSGTSDSLTRDYYQQVGNVSFAIYIILGAVFFVMILVIGNSMIQSYDERIKEIGVMKAMGYTDLQVYLLIMCEVAAVIMVGAGLGLLISLGLVEYAQANISTQIYMSKTMIALAFVLALLISWVVGSIPALKAKGLTITRALGMG